jgi:hypothetical protein
MWGQVGQIASLFSRLLPDKPCDPTERPHLSAIELRPTTWPRHTSRVGPTTFLQVSNERAAQMCGLILITHVPARKSYMAQGTVKFFKGFGFIQRGDGGKDVFVHIGAVERAGMRASTRDKRSLSTLLPIEGRASPRRTICTLSDRQREEL